MRSCCIRSLICAFGCCIRKLFLVSLAANVALKHMGEKKGAVAVHVLNKLQNEMGMGQGIRESATGPSSGSVSNFKSG